MLNLEALVEGAHVLLEVHVLVSLGIVAESRQFIAPGFGFGLSFSNISLLGHLGSLLHSIDA